LASGALDTVERFDDVVAPMLALAPDTGGRLARILERARVER